MASSKTDMKEGIMASSKTDMKEEKMASSKAGMKEGKMASSKTDMKEENMASSKTDMKEEKMASSKAGMKEEKMASSETDTKKRKMDSPEAGMKEVEEYLFTKLNTEIEKTKNFDRQNCLFKLDGYFESSKDGIKKLPDGRIEKREKIHYLFNLVSEWEMITKKHGIQYPEGLYEAYALKKKLKKLIKDLEQLGKDKKPSGDSTSQKHANQNQASKHPSAKNLDFEQSGEDSTAQQKTETKQDSGNKIPVIPKNLAEYRWSSRYRPNKVFGLDEKIKFIERFIEKKDNTEGFKAMAIFGIPGVGKTTICQVMYNHRVVKEHFDIRLWVCLSKQKKDDEDRKKEAVKRILACLGIEEEVIQEIGNCDDGLGKLLTTLRLQLVGKRYFIVLDDATSKNYTSSKYYASNQVNEVSWKDDSFFEDLSSNSSQSENKLAFGLPKGGLAEGEASMVMVTTRSEELAKMMVSEEHVHHLPLLEKEELCWGIFEANLDGITIQKDVEDLKTLVIKKCSGLPLSASMMGVIMREQLLNKKREKDKEKENMKQENHPDGK